MKKIYLMALLLSACLNSYATHLMGGEMTVEHTTGNEFIIHLTAYRDTFGIPFALTANFMVYDISNNVVVNSTVPQDTSSGNLMPAAPYGVEVYFFTDTISVPGPGQYRVEWWNCCRNGAITNLTAPLNENMFLYTTFTHYAASPFNSTPVFLAPPVTFVPINQPWQYNSLPNDPDGDSLVWTLDTPYTSSGVYAAGWVTPAATANGAFTLDPVSGQIDWTPSSYGNYVASIRVEEFRAGVKIGEIRRDYQMIVIDDTCKKAPRITNMNSVFPKDGSGHYYKVLQPGAPVSLYLTAHDDEGNPVEFLAYGEPFLQVPNAATFATYPFNTTDRLGVFQWTPDKSQARINPYIVVFRTRDQVFAFDETVLFYVGPGPTGIAQTAPAEQSQPYPNPAVDVLNVPVSLEVPTDVTVSLYNVAGRKAAEYPLGRLAAGDHHERITLDVSPGLYLVSVAIDGLVQSTCKVMVK